MAVEKTHNQLSAVARVARLFATIGAKDANNIKPSVHPDVREIIDLVKAKRVDGDVLVSCYEDFRGMATIRLAQNGSDFICPLNENELSLLLEHYLYLLRSGVVSQADPDSADFYSRVIKFLEHEPAIAMRVVRSAHGDALIDLMRESTNRKLHS